MLWLCPVLPYCELHSSQQAPLQTFNELLLPQRRGHKTTQAGPQETAAHL